jgi:hypothetical protein
MPYVIPNNVLSPEKKVIKPYDCSFIAIDGPQIKGKIDLTGLEILYENQYTSQIVLNESDKDIPVHYGFLGENITFLLIRAIYKPIDANFEIETDQYIEYYFSDDPTIKYMNKLMILTGNSVKRIPKVYLTNPSSDQKVYLEIFAANQYQSNIDSTLNNDNIFNNLYYNNIISDSLLNGSTTLYVIDNDDNIILSIIYDNIKTIERDNKTLLIGTDTQKIQLKFLSVFNLCQAHSRISWVIEDREHRKLTKNSPIIDIDAPDIVWTNSNIQFTGFTFSSGNTGTTLLKTDIIDLFVSGITDTIDGEMDKYDVTLEIYQGNNIVPVDNIKFNDGPYDYTLYFVPQDIACNTNKYTKYIKII